VLHGNFIFKVLSVINFLKTSLQPLARGIIQISTIHFEKNDKFLPMPANKNYPTDIVVHIGVLEGHSYKCIIYNIYNIILIFMYNITYNKKR